jgi:hypothetical protein
MSSVPVRPRYRSRPSQRLAQSTGKPLGRGKTHLQLAAAKHQWPLAAGTRQSLRASISARNTDHRFNSLETKPLVPRAQFLAGNTIPCPGDSLEAVGRNILATRFADAIRATGAARKRSLNFLQCSNAQIGRDHRYVLLDCPDRKLDGIRRLNARRKCLGCTPRGSQNLVPFLQQETSICLLGRLHCRCSHSYSPFPNLTRKTLFLVCPWIRMFEMIPRLHNFLKFFGKFGCA